MIKRFWYYTMPHILYHVYLFSLKFTKIGHIYKIYDFAAPSKVVSKPIGQWNTMEIQTQDQSYTVIINGQKVTEFTGDRLKEGYIGLQAHDDKSKVSFRNIMVKEIR